MNRPLLTAHLLPCYLNAIRKSGLLGCFRLHLVQGQPPPHCVPLCCTHKKGGWLLVFSMQCSHCWQPPAHSSQTFLTPSFWDCQAAAYFQILPKYLYDYTEAVYAISPQRAVQQECLTRVIMPLPGLGLYTTQCLLEGCSSVLCRDETITTEDWPGVHSSDQALGH